MASIYKKVNVQWQGAEYSFAPTFGQIEALEHKLDLYSLEMRFLRGEYPFTHMVRVLHHFLSDAGYEGSIDQMYAEANASNENKKALGGYVREALDACYPSLEVETEGKGEK